MKYYAIRNVNDASLAWSNQFGWVENDSYDLYTEQEKQTSRLPMEGRWSEIA